MWYSLRRAHSPGANHWRRHNRGERVPLDGLRSQNSKLWHSRALLRCLRRRPKVASYCGSLYRKQRPCRVGCGGGRAQSSRPFGRTDCNRRSVHSTTRAIQQRRWPPFKRPRPSSPRQPTSMRKPQPFTRLFAREFDRRDEY